MSPLPTEFPPVTKGVTNLNNEKLVTMLKDGVEIPYDPALASTAEVYYTARLEQPVTYIHARGIEPYRAAVWVDRNGIDPERSVTAALRGGHVSNEELADVQLDSISDDFGLLVLDGGSYRIRNATIRLLGHSDGRATNDFSGCGAAINCWGGARLVMENADIEVSGCVRPCLFVDSHSHVLVKGSRLHSYGGKTYEGYRSAASLMTSASVPWVLGLTGTSRTSQLMGNCSSATYVNCELSSDNWGVLSTDNGADSVLTVIDSAVSNRNVEPDNPYTTRFGSGYGSYIIANSEQHFYGACINAGTYIGVFRGGSAEYASSSGTFRVLPYLHILNGRPKQRNYMGEEYESYDVRRETQPVFDGLTGSGRASVLCSDGFGWMMHGEDNTLHIGDRTQVTTRSATFLHKAGRMSLVVDNAFIHTEDHILIQLMDDDDLAVGCFDMDKDWGPVFNDCFNEKPGWPGLDYPCSGVAGSDWLDAVFTNVELDGDIYNGSGYFTGFDGHAQQGRPATVRLGNNAVLSGAVAATSCIHVNERGEQNTHFTSAEYYYLSRVANRVHYNGVNDIHMILEGNAVWNVTGESLLSSLQISPEAHVTLSDGLCAFLDGKPVELLAGNTYRGLLSIRPQA